eukprot:CAMPEP_0205944556 /NCGR_PEP_ID=MMETSP1325-20131115/63559_1 /ASSEMBLY_ACC=CAM_ASM_000708 /TAXON_ID=236786 /ORGANISM="Florenciella sp., Strain RCC1007" /LENGTH=52 /DNA_ID=CAMNT_0053315465 /DNA_START=68 /DNA_END=223 /DNA_ORIENTATION=+
MSNRSLEVYVATCKSKNLRHCRSDNESEHVYFSLSMSLSSVRRSSFDSSATL